MSKKSALKSVSAIMGSTFAVSLIASPLANAAENPFEITALSDGYTIAGTDDTEGKCGEGKCGGSTDEEVSTET